MPHGAPGDPPARLRRDRRARPPARDRGEDRRRHRPHAGGVPGGRRGARAAVPPRWRPVSPPTRSTPSCHQAYIDRGGYPSTLNYRGYPKSLCTSVNEVICHGIPDDRALRDGDIVNLDVTIFLDGVHGDTNATYFVGQVDDASRRLVDVTRECLDRGIAAVAPGRPFSDIGRAIEEHATANGYEVVRAFVGHGIGEQFHTDLQIPHYYEPRLTTVMEPGMVFTIEPMISMGTGAAPHLGRRLDRGHRRRQPHRPVRAHRARHRRRRRGAHPHRRRADRAPRPVHPGAGPRRRRRAPPHAGGPPGGAAGRDRGARLGAGRDHPPHRPPSRRRRAGW